MQTSDILTRVGPRIKQLREERKWSLSDLSNFSGVSKSYLHQIEQGDSIPTIEKIQQIANAFGMLPSDLIEDDNRKRLLEFIPDSLREFSENQGLTTSEIQMLTTIQYRGKRPSSIQEWKAIYNVIKGLLE